MPGGSCIARVAAAAPSDATTLAHGQLVHVELAVGRSEAALAALRRVSPSWVETVRLVGDDEAANVEALRRFGPVDVFLDMSPLQAGKSLFKMDFACSRVGGRMSLMGGVRGDLEVAYGRAGRA